MDFKQSLEELGPIKVILTDVILLLFFAKRLLWLQEARLLPGSTAFGATDNDNISAQCWLHSYFYCNYCSWEISSNVEDKTGDKRIFLCFCLHRWVIWDRFIPCLPWDYCLKLNSMKIKVLFAAVKSNAFFQLTLSGLWGNGCEYVQHIAQLAPVLLGLSVLV